MGWIASGLGPPAAARTRLNLVLHLLKVLFAGVPLGLAPGLAPPPHINLNLKLGQANHGGCGNAGCRVSHRVVCAGSEGLEAIGEHARLLQ
jgi:hypothetical protein